ncbi:hypothetical protein DFJ58DRAFT_731909 [Suillus subalutaceus]|uniref:uncharacterized protein n=1 Tax=Suillus subalutaceus TaxID=48586 RepID=UPI001B869A13|nr:uncharacterized protein DFJ58DRAFT_731909 [Suillus subalutaceus]KAG1842750.1 hypothetical protein DFJ58DRAFT_731909 [Suillus subalutaceus]
MLVPDFTHEFELGVWKATLAHLLQILYSYGGTAVQDLNERYRLVPTFGHDTIHKFSDHVSGLTKLTARDFEDLLQCAMPVFDGLLPEPFNNSILNLLFELATWHAFGKLRMHTETTLYHFDNCTTRLGKALRRFRDNTCTKFATHDLPRETAARAWCRCLKASKGKTKWSEGTNTDAEGDGPSKQQLLNLLTYKLHALGDYIKSIWQYGTMDNYSTQVGELEHCQVKRFYAWTNKNKFVCGIARLQRRERILQRMKEVNHERAAAQENHAQPETEDLCPSLHFIDQDPLLHCSLEIHYQMSSSQKHYWDISSWLGKNRNDQATKNFLPHLKDHLLGRLSGLDYDGDETSFMLRVNYTTYDLRRAQDSLNPRTHADIMVLARDQEDSHPYWYARVIGVFHVNTRYMRPGAHPSIKRVDFLWVGFYDGDDESAFGFLDPDLVVRGVQLIPAFRYQRTTALLGLSIACQAADKDEDWDWYCINMFVDRDMFMHFRGGGVGHKTTRRETSCLLDDQDDLDNSPFQQEKERHLPRFDKAFEGDEDMDEHEDGDKVGDSEEEADDSEETDSMDGEDGDEVPAPFEVMVDNTVADEMDEYGYSGLDQVLDEDGAGEETNNDVDDFGPEDGEDVMKEFEEDSFADL